MSEPKTIFGILADGPLPEIIETDGRIQIGGDFKNPIPIGMPAEGQMKGTWTSPHPAYPGIPTTKFSVEQYCGMEKNEKVWEAQYKYHARQVGKYFVSYVGWTVWCHDTRKCFKETSQELNKTCQSRKMFLKAIIDGAPNQQDRQNFALKFVENFVERPDHIFWLYEDLSYFHSKIQIEYGRAEVQYMDLREDMTLPPLYKFTTFNLIDKSIFLNCMVSGPNFVRPEDILIGDDQTLDDNQIRNEVHGCDAGNTCHCNKVWDCFYRGAINMIPDRSRCLSFENSNPSDKFILIQCSDACGCTPRCVRRVLKNERGKKLVVFYENDDVGFELKAAEDIDSGASICELVGLVEQWTPETDETKYRFRFNTLHRDLNLSINASEFGNMARFIQTSDNPNVSIVEVYSHGHYVPRMALFARREIGIGCTLSIEKKQSERNTSTDD